MNFFPPVTTFVFCSSRLLMSLGSKQYGPRSDWVSHDTMVKLLEKYLTNSIKSLLSIWVSSQGFGTNHICTKPLFNAHADYLAMLEVKPGR